MENASSSLRSTASSLTNIIIVFSFFRFSLTGYGASHLASEWSFRLAFMITFVVPTIYFCGLPFFPESPVWYIKKDREDDAKKAILRLFCSEMDAEAHINKIRNELNQIKREESPMATLGWKSIFSNAHRSRTFIAVLGLQSQNFSGGYFANTYQTFYFELLGQSDSFRLTAISSTPQLHSNIVAVCFSDVIPRRMGFISASNSAANMVILIFMITWSMIYTDTVGCYGWAVAQETAAQVTRPKTISFVLVCQQLTVLIISSVFPYFINPDELNWGGKVMFLFVGAEIFITVFPYFFQPETKTRSYEDLNVLYAFPAKVRQFSVVDGQVVERESRSSA
ncbi:general substrate transporter [Aspergillus cavernicola]|uniref:General substrate transporter n=1 Tax=Aspergillus cavernicola TaxID=176166 RepID=A0ABR4HRP9_9EURO